MQIDVLVAPEVTIGDLADLARAADDQQAEAGPGRGVAQVVLGVDEAGCPEGQAAAPRPVTEHGLALVHQDLAREPVAVEPAAEHGLPGALEGHADVVGFDAEADHGADEGAHARDVVGLHGGATLEAGRDARGQEGLGVVLEPVHARVEGALDPVHLGAEIGDGLLAGMRVIVPTGGAGLVDEPLEVLDLLVECLPADRVRGLRAGLVLLGLQALDGLLGGIHPGLQRLDPVEVVVRQGRPRGGRPSAVGSAHRRGLGHRRAGVGDGEHGHEGRDHEDEGAELPHGLSF